jgi:AcrR family transcriptional regulator
MPRRPRTAPRRPPRQKRSAETVQVLLQATRRVLERDGFAAATTNKIAEAAGVSIGTLYHYYPTLESLIEAVVHQMWETELEVAMATALEYGGQPLEVVLRETVRALAAHVHHHRVLYLRWYAEAPHLGQLGAGLELATRAIAMLEAQLAADKARVRPTDLRFAADFAVKMVLAAVRTAARDYPAELASGRLAEALGDMVVGWLLREYR